jgi:transcriptional regulator of arginine metabolism
MKYYAKLERQRLLKKIVAEQGISGQNQLLAELRKQGIDTTQATISRDLQEMGFFKFRVKPGEYKYKMLEKTLKGEIWDRLGLLFNNFVRVIKSTKNMILVKTTPGNAQGVASLIDDLERKEILGTVAGDDTILIIIDSDNNRAEIEKEFKQLL